MATLLRHARIVNLVRVTLNGHQGSLYPKAAQSAGNLEGSRRYTSFARLQKAKSLDDVF
jgi:hypothetical protein